MTRRLGWVLIALVLGILLSCMGLFAPLDLGIALAFGWVFYLWRVVPEIRPDPAGLATAGLCLAAFAAGLHAFLGWLRREWSGGDGPPWPIRWTAAIVGGVLLMFVAGLAAAGVAHQAGWLIASGKPFVSWSGLGRVAARRAQSSNNLKAIGQGLIDHAERRGAYPPGATFDAAGRPLHGWQTALLPYLDRQDLADRIHPAWPWDHPANTPAYATEVPEYLNPGIDDRSPIGAYAPGHYAGNARLLGGDIPRRPEGILDGTSNTLLGGEVVAGIRPWGDPTHWRDPALGINRSPAGFGGPFPGGANMLMADGSVRFIRDRADPRVLEALSTPAGGEVITPDAY